VPRARKSACDTTVLRRQRTLRLRQPGRRRTDDTDHGLCVASSLYRNESKTLTSSAHVEPEAQSHAFTHQAQMEGARGRPDTTEQAVAGRASGRLLWEAALRRAARGTLKVHCRRCERCRRVCTCGVDDKNEVLRGARGNAGVARRAALKR